MAKPSQSVRYYEAILPQAIYNDMAKMPQTIYHQVAPLLPSIRVELHNIVNVSDIQS
jgi:hypothetical protein